jgi:hypothetical protein
VFVTPAIVRQFWAGSVTMVVDCSADGLAGYERRTLGMVWRSTHACRVREAGQNLSGASLSGDAGCSFFPAAVSLGASFGGTVR